MPPLDPAPLRSLLDQQRPATVLNLLGEAVPPELAVYKAEALMALDRDKEAHDYLDPIVPQLREDDFARAERVWAEILLRQGWLDGAILSAEGAARAAQSPDLRAEATAWSAVGYARKHCWNPADSALREARQIAPGNPLVLLATARVRLEMDQRLEARAVYDQMAQLDSVWARSNADWGCAHVAFLLGAFDEARARAESALQYSDEIVGPLFVLGQVAMATDDAPSFQRAIAEMERRSPQAGALKWWKEELERLQQRLAADPNARRKRLHAFPTTLQRRDHCGPCTIELVLRYWQGGLELTNEQIAQVVKFPGGGSPTYKMREFFHLVGFDTVRCLAPVDTLKALIDAGYPAIVQEEYSDSSHVAVVIGYDDGMGAIELQDPMTHRITALPVEELNRLRRMYLDSAIVAFPRGKGHDDALARLGLFDEAAIVWTDQAGLALDENRPQAAAELMARATAKLPAHRLSWILWLHAESDLWASARRTGPALPTPLAAKLIGSAGQDSASARGRYYSVLARAKELNPDAEFVHQFEGQGALVDGDVPRALAAYRRATEIDPDDGRNFASLAECYFALRDLDKATQAAWDALNRYPSLAAANAWVSRCLTYRRQRNAMHYARAAVDLAPNWWLPHQALAEALIAAEDYAAARRELDTALALWPDQPEARVWRGILTSYEGNRVVAAIELETALAAPQSLNTITAYDARRELCRILFGSNLYDDAVEQVKLLLALTPDDPWAIQFLAAARSQSLIRAGRAGDAEAVAEVRQRYDRGVEVNHGATWIVRDYLDALWALAGPELALETAARIQSAYPDNGSLIFVHAQYLSRAGQSEPAARAMLEALSRADGLQNADELYDAVYAIVEGLGPEAGERAALDAHVPDRGAPMAERQRALGLILALYPKERGDRARELLNAALATNPDDSYATLRLGDVSQTDADREALYRRALLLAPRWAFARAHLAEFLLEAGRAAEALEFTEGHENDSFDVLAAHGRALLDTGHCDEAIPVFEQAVSGPSQPTSSLHYWKWAAQEDCGQHEAALATAQAATPLFPKNLLWHLRAAISLRHLGKLDEAERVIEAGKAKGLGQEHILEAEYETAWARKDWSAALSAVERLIRVTGEKAGDEQLGYWENKRLRLLLALKRVDDARRFVLGEKLNADGWGRAAWTAMMAEEWTLCGEFAEKALALDPQHFKGLFTRAEALRGMDREAEALAAYHKLREAHPNEHNAYEKLGLLLALDGKTGEALELAERAVALGPFCPFSWATRGYVHFVRGDRALALADLQTAWGRADTERRRQANEYWWLLAALQNQTELAEDRKRKAVEEATNSTGRRQIEQIEALLSQ
jgi:tetratricopeptide (TPR) repeat protein